MARCLPVGRQGIPIIIIPGLYERSLYGYFIPSDYNCNSINPGNRQSWQSWQSSILAILAII